MSDLIASGECLYEVLNAAKGATDDEIKQAYKRKAMLCHPDRAAGKTAEEKEKMETEFKKTGFAYAILRDAQKKRLYDDTGAWEAAMFDESDFDLSSFMRAQFANITEERIQEYDASYKASEQERQDLQDGYRKAGGHFLKTLEYVHYDDTSKEEEERLHAMLEDMIAAGVLKETAKWRKTKLSDKVRESAAYKKRWAQRLKEAEEVRKSSEYLKVMGEKVSDPKKPHSKQADLALAMSRVAGEVFSSSFAKLASRFDVDADEMDELNQLCGGSNFEAKFLAAKKAVCSKKRPEGGKKAAEGEEEEEASPPPKKGVKRQRPPSPKKGKKPRKASAKKAKARK